MWLEGGEGEERAQGKVRPSRRGKVLGLALALKVMSKSLDLILRTVESCESILRRKVK